MRHGIPGLGSLTEDEFLRLESVSLTRHEFVGGRMYTLAGTTARHNTIVTSIHARLRHAARGGPCQAYVIDQG